MISIVGDTLSIHKGDSGIIEVQAFTDESKTTPLDITGHTVNFQVGDDFAEPYSTMVIKKDNGGSGGVVITDAAQGKYQIQFAKVWTNALTVKPYVYSTKVITPGGSVYTMAAGRFVLMQNVAHE